MRERLDWIILSRSYCSIIIHLCTITFDHWYHTSFVWNFHSKKQTRNRRTRGNWRNGESLTNLPSEEVVKRHRANESLLGKYLMIIYLYSFSKNHYIPFQVSTYIKLLKDISIKKYFHIKIHLAFLLFHLKAFFQIKKNVGNFDLV